MNLPYRTSWLPRSSCAIREVALRSACRTRDDVVMGSTTDDDDSAGEVSPRRVVHVIIRFTVVQPSRFLFAIAPAADAGTLESETFSVIGANGPIQFEEIVAPHGSRLQLLSCDVGPLSVTYDARLESAGGRSGGSVDRFETLLYGRPSRYCPSDHMSGFAVAEFGTERPALERTASIVEWIGQRVGYLAGSSSVHDSAEHTLLTGAGTCRDFAHLGVALCRAIDIPARFTSAYAPGLSPMDFHAVFEVFDNGRWWLFDPTHSAPRRSMSRIATGRDAADTAFATVLDGIAQLDELAVIAVVDGPLPEEDTFELIELP
jgi:transglutaminase-like putative cysteine protease